MSLCLAPLNMAFFNRQYNLRESVRTHICHLLAVNKGSAPCDPEYGVNLRYRLFTFHEYKSLEEIKKDIVEAIIHSDKRLKLDQVAVNVESNPDRSQVQVLIHIDCGSEGIEEFGIIISNDGIILAK